MRPAFTGSLFCLYNKKKPIRKQHKKQEKIKQSHMDQSKATSNDDNKHTQGIFDKIL